MIQILKILLSHVGATDVMGAKIEEFKLLVKIYPTTKIAIEMPLMFF
jgi:hypothetical protein